MIHDLHIVVGDTVEGEVKLLHISTDAQKAEQAFHNAGDTFEAVRLFMYPQHTRMRRPADDAAMMRRNDEEADIQSRSRTERLKVLAKAKALEAEKLLAQAEALRREAAGEAEPEVKKDLQPEANAAPAPAAPDKPTKPADKKPKAPRKAK